MEVKSPIKPPASIKLERHGDVFYTSSVALRRRTVSAGGFSDRCHARGGLRRPCSLLTRRHRQGDRDRQGSGVQECAFGWRRAASARVDTRNDFHRDRDQESRLSSEGTLRGTELVTRRADNLFSIAGGKILSLPVDGRLAGSGRHRSCCPLQHRSRNLAGWQSAGDQS